jgi:glycosyltransferase XagB
MTRDQRWASAAVLLTPGQIILELLLFCALIVQGAVLGWHDAFKEIVAAAIVFYLLFTGFRHVLWIASGFHRYPRYTLPDPNDPALPTISALIALRDEAESVGNLVTSITRLDYRKDRLQVLLLIDEDDDPTLEAVGNLLLPEYIQVVRIPDAGPYLKPKVLNYGYQFATGDLIVPFDAEDRVPKDQLLHAVATLWARPKDRRGRRIGGFQARLTFWNPRGINGRGWVSAMSYGEYCVQYLDTLPGMSALGLIFPYGGTSCYFLREALDDITRRNGMWAFPHRQEKSSITFSGPWDLNPTEDADIAWRLALAGWGSAMVRSTTNEEAPTRVVASGHQGTRWLHGYSLTGLVSMRKPLRSIRQVGLMRWFTFNLFMLGTPFSLVINPITWATTILYIVSRFEGWTRVSSYIHGLFPWPVFYVGLLVMLANFSLYLQNIFAIIKAQEMGERQPTGDALSNHKQQEQYGITLWVACGTIVWWAWRSVSAWRSMTRLLSPKNNHSWGHKTPHGAALGLEADLRAATQTELA